MVGVMEVECLFDEPDIIFGDAPRNIEFRVEVWRIGFGFEC